MLADFLHVRQSSTPSIRQPEMAEISTISRRDIGGTNDRAGMAMHDAQKYYSFRPELPVALEKKICPKLLVVLQFQRSI